MKVLITLFTLFASTVLLANENNLKIEIGENKGTEYHSYYFGVNRVHMITSVAYRVTNTGPTPINVISMRMLGTNYGAVTNCRTLMPNERCLFRIDYRPFFEGYHTGRLILSFDQNSTIQVDVSGQAIY